MSTLTISLTNIYRGDIIKGIEHFLNVTKLNDIFYLKDYTQARDKRVRTLMMYTFNQFDKQLINTCVSYFPNGLKDITNVIIARNRKEYPYSASYRRIDSIFNNDVKENKFYIPEGETVCEYEKYDLNNFAHIFMLFVHDAGGYFDCDCINVMKLLLQYITNDDKSAIMSLLISLYSYIMASEKCNTTTHWAFYTQLIQHFVTDLDVFGGQHNRMSQISKAIRDNNDSVTI